MEIGIRELKNRLSEIVHRANQGEQITITNHGQPLCLLTPVQVEEIKRPEFLERAIAEGRVRPATRTSMSQSTPITPRKAGPTTTELITQSRRELRF